MKKSRAFLILVVILSMLLAGCSSSFSSNIASYNTQLSQKRTIWEESKGAPTPEEAAAMAAEAAAKAAALAAENASADDGRTALAAPTGWTVDTEGNYSFNAVDGAGYYIVYLYDARSEDSSFAYMSSNIEEDGSETYAGKLSDLFDYCYGIYDAEVVAYPAVGTKGMKKSAPAESSISVIGEVEEAKIGYLWDCFAGTLGVELINVENYGASAYPASVEVKFTNTADASDVITLGFENVSVADDIFYASTDAVTKDATYAVTAKLTWDAEIVTNPEASLDLGTLTTASNKNVMTDGYGYLNSNVYLSLDYPMVVNDFNPAEGGSAGTWFYYINAFVTSKGVAIPSTFRDMLNFQGEKGAMGAEYHDGENIDFLVTPTDTKEGSAYSYTLLVQGPRGVVSLFDGFFYNDMPAAAGSLELYPDGTFLMTIDPPVDDGSSPFGPRGVAGSSIEGIWIENGDGTLTLSYNHGSVTGGSTER